MEVWGCGGSLCRIGTELGQTVVCCLENPGSQNNHRGNGEDGKECGCATQILCIVTMAVFLRSDMF